MSSVAESPSKSSPWPALPLQEWSDTCTTLHMWTQIVGKVRMALSPHVNHWWEVPLYVNARGLTTSAIPWDGGIFELQFDFLRHVLEVQTSWGAVKSLPLTARPVADFYRETMSMLESVGIHVKIWTMPVEVPDPIAFDQDRTHASYDPEYARQFWQVLITSDTLFSRFRAGFIGKCSPVHFFWGSFDLAVTRFCGRRAPERTGADAVTRDAYSHEVISAGFWPGSGGMDAAYYSYTVPEPAGLAAAPIRPASASYNQELKEFIVMYEDIRRAPSPPSALMDFLESTYEAGANLAKWDRASLEKASPAA